MVWRIRTGVDPQTTVTNWRNIHFKKEINGLGRADIEIFDVKPHQRADTFEISHLVKSVIEISDGGVVVFEGFIDDVEVSEPNMVRLLCVAYEILLFDELITTRDYVTGTTDVAEAIKGVLDTYSNKVKYRSDEITTASVNITKEYSYDNLFKVVHDLTFLGGQEFWVKRYGTEFRLHTANERGNGSATSPVATFNTALDTLNNIDRKRLSESVNKITVVGKGDGINMITRTVPGDATHALATAAQTKYGVIHEIVRDQSIDNNADADTLAGAILDKIHEPVNKIKLNRSRHNPNVHLGDYVQIKNSKQNVDIVKRIKRITADISISALPDVTYEFVEKDDGIDGVITEIRRQELTARVHQQGATNMMQIGFPDNATNGKPYKLKFYVPFDVKRVNKAELNFSVEDFRFFSEATGSNAALVVAGSADLSVSVHVPSGTDWESVSGGSEIVDMTNLGSNTSNMIVYTVTGVFTVDSATNTSGELVNAFFRLKQGSTYYPIDNSGASQISLVSSTHEHVFGHTHTSTTHRHKWWSRFGSTGDQAFNREGDSPDAASGGGTEAVFLAKTASDNDLYTFDLTPSSTGNISAIGNQQTPGKMMVDTFCITIICVGEFTSGSTDLELEIKMDNTDTQISALNTTWYAISDHTHNITSGIFESSPAADTGTYDINGNSLGSYNGTTNISITTASIDIASSEGNADGYNTITITPTATNDQRINALLFLKFYIESK